MREDNHKILFLNFENAKKKNNQKTPYQNLWATANRTLKDKYVAVTTILKRKQISHQQPNIIAKTLKKEE